MLLDASRPMARDRALGFGRLAPTCALSLVPCPSFAPGPTAPVSPSQPAPGRDSQASGLVSALRVTIARSWPDLPTGRLASLRSVMARPARHPARPAAKRGLFQNSEIPAPGAAIETQGGFGQAKRPLPLLGQALRACPSGDRWSPTATRKCCTSCGAVSSRCALRAAPPPCPFDFPIAAVPPLPSPGGKSSGERRASRFLA